MADHMSIETEDKAHGAHGDNARLLKKLIIGGGLLTSAIMIAPHLLPLIDIGTTESTLLISQCSTNLAESASVYGTGIAGWVAGSLSQVPLIGESLAKGGFTASLTSGAIGTGGAFFAHYLHQKTDGGTGIRWGNVIKTACLLTSAFVALPAILPALGMGISYFALMFGATGLAASTISTFGVTAASIGGITSSWGVAGLVAPHLISCGLAFGGAAMALLPGRKSTDIKDSTVVGHADALPVSRFADRVIQTRALAPSQPALG